jgi:hypothetical protein
MCRGSPSSKAPLLKLLRGFDRDTRPCRNRVLVPTDRGTIHDFLASTVLSSLCVAVKGDGTAGIRVVLDAAGSGHDFPSGAAQDRRLWTEVIAYKGGQVIYQSGVVADGVAPTGNPDPDFWMIRDCMLDAQGRPVSMFWQASSYETNLLPAQLTFDALDPRYYQSHIIQNFPRDPAMHFGQTPDRVTLRLRLQPVGPDVLDDRIQSGDLEVHPSGEKQKEENDRYDAEDPAGEVSPIATVWPSRGRTKGRQDEYDQHYGEHVGKNDPPNCYRQSGLRPVTKGDASTASSPTRGSASKSSRSRTWSTPKLEDHGA